MEIIDEEIKGLLNEMMQHDLEPYWECGSRPLHDLWSLARARTGLK